jgi:hypothetical protein
MDDDSRNIFFLQRASQEELGSAVDKTIKESYGTTDDCYMTVEYLIDLLKSFNPDARIAFWQNDRKLDKFLLLRRSDFHGERYFKNEPRIQTEGFIEEDFHANCRFDMIETLVFGGSFYGKEFDNLNSQTKGEKYSMCFGSTRQGKEDGINYLFEKTQEYLDRNDESVDVISKLVLAKNYNTALSICSKYVNWIDLDEVYPTKNYESINILNDMVASPKQQIIKPADIYALRKQARELGIPNTIKMSRKQLLTEIKKLTIF